MNKLEQTVAPTESPITVAEMKSNARVDISTDDTIIQSYIDAATEYAQEVTWRQFVTATYALYLDEFPSDGSAIVIPRPPLSSISSITYVDTDGNTQTWSSALYEVDAKAEPGLVQPIDGQSYPDTKDQLNAVTITYLAGYGGASSVPDNIKQAIYYLSLHYYDRREGVVVSAVKGMAMSVPIPDAVMFILQKNSIKAL